MAAYRWNSVQELLRSILAIARESTLEEIRMALQRRGIEFFNGGSPGVRFHPEKAVILV